MDKILVIQIIAHFLADFFFMPKSMWKGKRDHLMRSWHIYAHMIIVFLTSFLLTPTRDFLLYAIVITLSHIVIDVITESTEYWLLKHRIKNDSETNYNGRYKLSELLFVNQILHLLSVYLFVKLYCMESNLMPDFLNDFSLRTLLIIFCIVFCTKPTGVYIKNYLRGLRLTSPDEESPNKTESGVGLDRAGREIGYIERIVTLLLVLLGQYTAIGFIITAKSVLRHSNVQFKKTEYVLTGTLFSFGTAIIVSVLLTEGVLQNIIEYVSICN